MVKKLIVLDLDKTLLHNDGSLSDYSVKVLNDCRDKGILVAVASYRKVGIFSKEIC